MKSSDSAISNFLGQFPLRVVFTLPFILQIFAIVAVIGWLSFRSGQQAVFDVAGQLRNEITARIQDTLIDYLETPHLINRINAEAIRQKILDPEDIPGIERYLFNQIQQFDTVGLIALGTEQGNYIEVQRYQNGDLNVAVTDETTGGNLQIWATDERGNRTELENTVSQYDPRQRPWYQAAASNSAAVWTDIYPLFSDQTLAISANQPFYDDQNKLAAVATTDLTLSQINDFLRSLKVGKTGQTFIMERSGALVASSTLETPAVTEANSDEAQRLNVIDSPNPLLQQTTKHLIDRFGNLNNISGNQQLDFDINGKAHFLQATPFFDERGIDWLIVVVIPQSDFTGQLIGNVRTTAVLSLIALLMAMTLGFFTARWVVQPILSLNNAAGKLADGDWDQTIPVKRADEVGGLARSFNRMATQLKETFATLQSNEEKYRTLFEDSRDTIFISKPTGEIIDMNPAGLKMFGYTKSEVSQKNARDFYAIPEERIAFRKQIEESGSVKDFSGTYIKKDGTRIDGLITAAIRRRPNGSILNYQGIIRDITAQKKAEQERLRLTALEQELTLARAIQRSLLLPPTPAWPTIDLVCFTQPAHEMGGDLYAYYNLADNKYAVTVGDVSGKGMPAALLMSVSLASLQSTVQQQLSPKKLLSHLNDTLSTYTYATKQNLALAYVEISPPNLTTAGTLRAVNAGCIVPIVRRTDGRVDWLDAFGLPLGVELNARFNYEEATASLHHGDLIILISDGVVEAGNHHNELFGFDRLQKAIATGPDASAGAMLAHLQVQINNFTQGADPHDDMTIVVLQV